MREQNGALSVLGLIGLLLGLVLVAGACGDQSLAQGSHDHAGTPLVAGEAAGTEYGVVPEPALPVAAPEAPFDPGSAIASFDGAVLVGVDGGELRFRDGTDDTDDTVLASWPIEPSQELRAVASHGLQAALLDLTDDRSRVTVVDARTEAKGVDGPDVVSFDLPGLVEPEAFSTDGTLLFVIDHQAGDEPGTYRVRPLNLATGELEDIVGPTKVPFDENMKGEGRRQVWSPDGTRLYTLYIRQGGTHQHDAAVQGFIHVLDLTEEWAYCLDLPAGFGEGDLTTAALAVSPDGEAVAVADEHAGQVAFASAAELEVTDVVDLPDLSVLTTPPGSTGSADEDGGSAPEAELHLALAADHLVLGRGTSLQWYETSTVQPVEGVGPILLDGELAGLIPDGTGVLAWTVGAMQPMPLAPPH